MRKIDQVIELLYKLFNVTIVGMLIGYRNLMTHPLNKMQGGYSGTSGIIQMWTRYDLLNGVGESINFAAGNESISKFMPSGNKDLIRAALKRLARLK